MEVFLGVLPLGNAPGQDPLENERQAELAGQTLALGQPRRGSGVLLDIVPSRRVGGELAERGM